MRHEYDLTDETLRTFKGNEQEIADEAEVGYKHISAILGGSKTDPFAPFVHFYAATARAQVSRCHWRMKLDAIDAKYDKALPSSTPIDCLTAKIKSDAETTQKMVEALKDGAISDGEAHAILKAVQKEREVLDLIETVMQFRVSLETGNTVRNLIHRRVA